MSNEKIVAKKAEIFDLAREQGIAQNKYNELEKVKQKRHAELKELEDGQKVTGKAGPGSSTKTG